MVTFWASPFSTLPCFANDISDTPQSETDYETLIPITTGNLYDSVMNINSALELSESSSTLYITMSFESEPTKQNIVDFLSDAVQILMLSEMGVSYPSIAFTLWGDDCMEFFSVDDFVSIYNFSSNYLGSFSGSEVVKTYFPTFYYAVFGGHDVHIASDKFYYDLSKKTGISGYSLPDEYRNGYLWIYSNFNELGSLCGYEVNDSIIQLNFIRSDTEDAGVEARQNVNAALTSFDNFVAADPESMPYVKIQFLFKTSSGKQLWNYTIEKLSNSWSATINEGSGNFLIGLNSK